LSGKTLGKFRMEKKSSKTGAREKELSHSAGEGEITSQKIIPANQETRRE